MTYAYPLGTGAAWANPIELTQVYIVARLILILKCRPKIRRQPFRIRDAKLEICAADYELYQPVGLRR